MYWGADTFTFFDSESDHKYSTLNSRKREKRQFKLCSKSLWYRKKASYPGPADIVGHVWEVQKLAIDP